MLEKVINSMLYGNLKTKVFFWSVSILGMAAIICIIMGIVTGNAAMGGAGFFLALLTLIVSQSVSLKDLQRPSSAKKKKISGESINAFAKQGESQSEEDDVDEEEQRRRRDRAKAQYLAGMDAKKLKKVLKEHKVNQIHVKAMIDSFPEAKLEQTPAFLWRTDTKLHILALADKAMEFEIPLKEIRGILLVKNVPVDTTKDYLAFKYENFLTKMFRPLLPEYFESSKEGKLEIRKNTFYIEPGVYFTNASVADLKRVLLPDVAFLVDDAVIASKHFDEYFKELYRYSLLCKNLVITLDEYQAQITKTMDALLDAPITGTEFVKTIRDLSRYHLINREHVTDYTQRYRELHLKNG